MGTEWTTGWNGLLTIGIPVILAVIAFFILMVSIRTKQDDGSGAGTGGNNNEPSPCPSPTSGSDLQETYAKRKKRRY